jgi:Na+/melibiose symporter-like transporter
MSDGPETAAPKPLPTVRILIYALPALVSSVAFLPLVLFVPAFYADDLGVALAGVGMAIAASRLLDVITDPLIGTLSDRLQLGWGRRKPWILLGTPLFLVSLWQVFVPGENAGAGHLFIWSALLYLGFTMLDVPHKAWGAELSVDYDDAARGVTAAGFQLRGIAVVIVAAMPLLVASAALFVPEGRPEGFREERRGVWDGLRLVTRNPAFGRMVGCVIFFVAGVAIQGTLHRLVLSDVMGDESSFAPMLLVENVATLAAVPIWLRISLRVGKPRALIAAALWIALLSLPLAFLRTGDTTLLIACIAVRGSSFASILFLSNSIAADVIDVDTLASGKQRSGLYFAAWGMTTKLSLALGVLLGTALPAALGYEPTDGLAAPAVQARLMAIYGGVPAVMMTLGALFLRGFPITRERHAEVRAALEARIAADSSTPG